MPHSASPCHVLVTGDINGWRRRDEATGRLGQGPERTTLEQTAELSPASSSEVQTAGEQVALSGKVAGPRVTASIPCRVHQQCPQMT